MISGQTDEDQLAKLRESGALNVFMRKPWNPAILTAECRKLLEES